MTAINHIHTSENRPAHRVSIKTGARLHFGFFSVNQPHERQFGGVGVMIDSPSVSLTATLGTSEQQDHAGLSRGSVATTADLDRVLSSARRFRSANHATTTQISFELEAAIPAHRGLGSGTQLGLAVALAMSVLAGDRETQVTEIARRVGRGNRSAVGIHGFAHGGCIVDGGSDRATQIGELSSREPFPDAWRFVLVFPPVEAGLSGSQEQKAFSDLPPMPTATTSRLRMLASDVIQPSIARADFTTVSNGLREFGFINGEYFSPIQGGVFTNSRMTELAEWLQARGHNGVGQSSWGPSLWTLCEGQSSAENLVSELRSAEWADCEFTIASPMNRGALIDQSRNQVCDS